MKKQALLLASMFVLPFANAGGLVKPGLWEVHVIKQLVDGQDMAAKMAAAQERMQEQMAKMSPAQRKQMEQMMGGQAMPMGGKGGHRLCISQEMAAQDRPMMPPEAKCEPTKFERSGNKTTFEINCAADGRNTVGKGQSVNNGDTVLTKMDMTMTDARGKHTMQSESEMRFIGADCQGVKPPDQLMREMRARAKAAPKP